MSQEQSCSENVAHMNSFILGFLGGGVLPLAGAVSFVGQLSRHSECVPLEHWPDYHQFLQTYTLTQNHRTNNSPRVILRNFGTGLRS